MIEGFHIVEIIQHEIPNLIAEIIDPVHICAAFEGGGLIVRQECSLDILLGVFKIQNKGAVFTRICAVQTGQGLY